MIQRMQRMLDTRRHPPHRRHPQSLPPRAARQRHVGVGRRRRTLLELGARVGRLEFVSHCYQRPRHLPLWPYNLFAMIHGHDRDEVMLEAAAGRRAARFGSCRQHDVLFSTRILKKTGLRLVA